jgi:cell division protein FtsI (penicillin-binding protein 3)
MHTSQTDKRYTAFVVALLLVISAFVGRLIYVQVVDADRLNALSTQARETTRTIPAIRGNIIDSDGRILATTVVSWDVNVDPKIVGPVVLTIDGEKVAFTKDQMAEKLSGILNVPTDVLIEKMTGTSRYANLKKSVSAAVFTRLKDLKLPWLYFDQKQERHYPDGAVAGNLLGFVGSDGSALEGIERMMNSCLAGTDGKETYIEGADRIRIPSSVQTIQQVKHGSDVVLSINSDLQYSAQQEMAATVRRLKADWASAIVIEVATGRILAAAEAPTVDPNNPSGVQAQNRSSRIFRAAFEPGSILKPVAAATAVDVGKATALSEVIAPYSLRMPWGERINDSHQHAPDKLTLTGVLVDSSNTGIVQLGGKVDSKTRYEYMQKFGMGSKSGVNFEGESSGLLADYKNWDKMTDKTVMFGQGVSLTPIQTAGIFQAIANKGVRLSPVLVEGCVDNAGTLTRTAVDAPVKVITEETAATTIDMLEKVVEFGSIGKTARIQGYRVGGKTGTAQIAEGKGYGRLYAVSFVGLAPVEDPKYIVAVTAFRSRTISNSLGATPGFVSVMKQVLKTYAVPPSTTKSKKIAIRWK